MSNLIFRRTLVNALMFSVTGICAVATLSVLLFIVAYLIWNGGQALDWDFLTQLPKAPGENGGGMANAILGTSQILFLASLVAIPIGSRGSVRI
jgi:phosphate transport system permease protein